MEDKTLKEKIDILFEKAAKEEPKKNKFNLPLSIRIMKGKLRKNYILVLFIYMNGNTVFKLLPIEDNTVKVNDIYYDATADYILRYKKWPLLILPEWNILPVHNSDGTETKRIEPWKPKDDLGNAIDEGTLTTAEKFILAKVKLEMVKPKFKMNIMALLIILGLIGGGYFLLKYLKMI